mmetsp:Transcript_7602/g.13776  ORF Transcript_7602/g.13776 Transcript_7602/m.13776 type:complete len:124 (-) Transcript_7602:1860-2231(-)
MESSSSTLLQEGDVVIVENKTHSEVVSLFLGVLIEATEIENEWKVQPLCQRDDHEEYELFMNSKLEPMRIQSDRCKWIDSYMSQRIISDRIENPHGEESEYCWILQTSSPIPVNLFLSINVPE